MLLALVALVLPVVWMPICPSTHAPTQLRPIPIAQTLLDVIAGRKTQGIIEARACRCRGPAGACCTCLSLLGVPGHGAWSVAREAGRQAVPCAAHSTLSVTDLSRPSVILVLQGEILLNGHPKEEGTWKRVSAYVEQVRRRRCLGG